MALSWDREGSWLCGMGVRTKVRTRDQCTFSSVERVRSVRRELVCSATQRISEFDSDWPMALLLGKECRHVSLCLNIFVICGCEDFKI